MKRAVYQGEFFTFYMIFKNNPKLDIYFRKKLFLNVFEQILDYSNGAFIENCAKWGLDTLEMLEQNGLVIVAADGERRDDFIYAATTAVIIGEFGQCTFNNHFSDETEIDLNQTGLVFDGVEAYLDDAVQDKHREELRKGNFVNIQDIWPAVQEWKKETHQALVDIYVKKGEKEPICAIYASLVAIFEEQDKETKENYAPAGTSGEMRGYSYVSDGFQY